eukprot:3920456-Amphidinium_carterae.3
MWQGLFYTLLASACSSAPTLGFSVLASYGYKAVVLRSIRITYAAAFDEAAGLLAHQLLKQSRSICGRGKTIGSNTGATELQVANCWEAHHAIFGKSFGLDVTQYARSLKDLRTTWQVGRRCVCTSGSCTVADHAAFLFTALLFVPSVAMSAILGVSFIVSGVLLARRLQDLRCPPHHPTLL